MEGNEYDIFSELEHEMGRDLSQWRRDIVSSFEKCCRIAHDIEESRAGDAFDTTDPTIYGAIKRHTIDFHIADWLDRKESPHPGDIIAVTGESYWYTLDEANNTMTPFRLPIGYKIEGPLVHWDIQPYIDEAGLALGAYLDEKLASQHTHPFGLHLILDHPTFTSDAGSLLEIDADQVYVPMHYERADLKLFSAD